MMRGPSYDDAYISRKMSQMPGGPTFSSPGPVPYGRPPAYMQDSYTSPYSSYSAGTTLLPSSMELREERRSVSPSPLSHTSTYRPSASTQMILNRVALGRSCLPDPPRPAYSRCYPPMGPPPRMMPRMAPSYYDYDYGYGGGYYYMPPPPPPRMSRYESYLDDGEMLESPYTPRYRPRVVDMDDTELRDKSVPHVTTTTSTTTTPRISSYTSTRPYSPGTTAGHHHHHQHAAPRVQDESLTLVPRPGHHKPRPHLQSLPRPDAAGVRGGETEGERHLARLAARYPSLSEPQMLQDHVDKMRIRLKSLAYSLDPTGPVPEIILPERARKSAAGVADDKKYSSALEFNELPKLASRRQRYYPEDDQMKDNLRIKCLSHYKTTRTQAGYSKSRLFDSSSYDVLPDSSSRLSKFSSSKWEEPDTVFGGPSDRKPYSKVETGSSFFSTYGFTNRKKDYVGEKVRDYYYFGADNGAKAITDGTTEEPSEEKKERRKKKKSKEREVALEAASATEATPAADVCTSEVEAVSAPSASEGGLDDIDDEKERKKQEKKKRKAEREAAAKAAMEAELAALAAAEAELARLEAESTKTDAPAPEPASEAEVAAEVKSESAAEK